MLATSVKPQMPRSLLLLSVTLLVVLVALPHPSFAIADPAGGAHAGASGEGNVAAGAAGDANPLGTLGSDSPLCGEGGLSGTSQANCRQTGALSHPFPLDNYGLDEQVQWGATHLGNTFDRVTQWLIQSIWHVFLYVFSGVLTMLEWAFSLDLLSHPDGQHVTGMAKLTEALQTLHDTVIKPWTLAAIAALALWGIWNGLVHRKTIDTLRGLAVALICMVGLLVLINDPVDTLGKATNLANTASKQILNSISRGTVQDPNQGVASAEQGLFASVILRPWCALQFADVDYCHSTPPGLKQSVADTWLQDAPDSPWRTSLWNITGSATEQKAREEGFGMDPPGGNRDLGDMYSLAGHPEKVELLGNSPGSESGANGGTMPRLALLLLILVGLIGAICLFSFLAMRLLLAALFVLILMLFAPAMFLVAALGESGRLSVFAWGKRLLGAIVVKDVYAFVLAVVVAASNLVIELRLGFFATWLVFIPFWWGVFVKRKDLLALLSLDHKSTTPSGIGFEGSGGGNMLSQLFYAKQLAGSVGRAARPFTRAATSAPRAALRKAGPRVLARKAGEHFRREREAARLGESDTIRERAGEELQAAGREALRHRYAAEHEGELATAQPALAEEQRRSRRLGGIDNELAAERNRRQAIQTKLNATTRGTPAWTSLQGELERADGRIGALQLRRGSARADLDSYRSDPDYLQARRVASSRARQVGDRDVQTWISQRRGQLAGSVYTRENLWAAGVNPLDYASADKGKRAEYRQMAQDRIDRDRELLDRLDGPTAGGGHTIGYRKRRQARGEASGNASDWNDYVERSERRSSQYRERLRADRRRRNVR